MNPNLTTTGTPPTFGTFQSTTAPSAPGFGTSIPSATPSFGMTGSTGFSFGTGGATFGTGGSSFGNTQFGNLGKGVSPVTTSAFSSTVQKPTTTSASVGFNLPTPASATGGFTLGAPINPTAPTGFTFGTASATNFGSPASSTTSSLTNPSISISSSLPAYNLGQPLSTTTPSVPASTTAATSTFNIGPIASTTGALNQTAITSAPFSLTMSGPTITTSANATAAPPTFGVGSTTTVTTSVPESAPTADSAKSSVNFAEMDDTIHKWTLELVELEQTFLNQMDQVRDWDRLLLSTGDKIVGLNDSMQKVKLRQQQLDHELDFIVAQQRELVECLQPLEKEFADITVSDPERNSIYQRAENLNTQLQQVSEDLKGVIEHINERNRSQDTSDPIVQIGRILNAHMNSLQWVDQNSAVIQQMLDQIGKMKDIHRRDADSTQNL